VSGWKTDCRTAIGLVLVDDRMFDNRIVAPLYRGLRR
jgi:hypothetical protein